MEKKLCRKYLVIGVIILFSLMAVTPMVIAYTTRKVDGEWANNTDKNIPKQEPKTFERLGKLKKPLNETVVLAPNSAYFTTNAFNSYKTYRESNGQIIKCESLEILMNPDADQIREFLKKNYSDGNQRYLLILGDENLVPCKYCYDYTYNDRKFKVHSDYYYGDLEGDWDYDSDGNFGEFQDDQVDILNPEFLVGRLPGSTLAEIDAILNRTIAFEKEKGSWKRNMLLTAGSVFISGDSSLVMNFIDWFRTPSCYNVTTISDDWILKKPDIILNETSFRKTWSEGKFGLVYVICHGSKTALAYYRGPDDYPEIFDMVDVPNLNSDYPAVFVSLACMNNQQYNGKTLGKALILNHSVGVIASSTLTVPGHFPFPISGIWAETFFPRMYLSQAQNLGMAIQSTKEMYYRLFVRGQKSPVLGNPYQMNLIAFILYGDPLVKQC